MWITMYWDDSHEAKLANQNDQGILIGFIEDCQVGT